MATKVVESKAMNLTQRLKTALPKGGLERIKEQTKDLFDISRRSIDRRFSLENFRKHEKVILSKLLGCTVSELENPDFEFDASKLKYPDPTTGK